MAADGVGKLRSKRNQTPSKPYERKSSLFGKLKDSVKDLLIPSWLSGTPLKQEKTDEVPTAQHSGEISRSVGRTSQASPDWSHGNTFPADNRIAPGHVGGAYGNSAPGRLPISNIPGFGYQPPNGDLPSDQSRSMFAGPSSLSFNHGSQAQPVIAPNVTAGGMVLSKHSDPIVIPDSDNQRQSGSVDNHAQNLDVTPIRPIMVSTGLKSSTAKPDAKRQRLWSPEPIRQGKPLMPPPRGRPSFNSLLFGTPSKGDTTVTSNFGDSSFYVGKTCYGGASSAKRKSLNTSLPYQSSLPLRKQVKVTKMNSTFHATTSSTAQRILDTLERMSTPLEDAKKIPQGDQGNDSVLSFTPSSYRRQTSQCSVRPITRPLHLRNRGPPTSQLQSTPQVEIAKNRDRFRPARRGSESVLSITQETVTAQESARTVDSTMTPQALGLKLKSKKFSQHISARQEEEIVVPPNLSTGFTLPLSGMAPITLSSVSDKSAMSTKPCDASPLKFNFATPIEEKNCQVGSQFGRQSEQAFKFSTPIHVTPNKASAAGAEGGAKSSPEPAVGAANPQASTWAPQMMKPKAISPDIGGTSSSFKSYTKWSGNSKTDIANGSLPVGVPAAATLKKGSVMDILGKSTQSSDNNTPLSELFKKPAGSWECDTCMIQNKADTNRCVACSALKPGSKSNNCAVGNQEKPPLSAMFQMPEGSWECDTCLVQNDSSANKCVACATPKQGSKPQEKGAGNGSVPLSEMFKKPEGTWECSTCMIQNTPSTVKCVACQTPKSGQVKSGQSSSQVPLSQLFKKPEGTWECNTCMIENTPSTVKCVACETPKPGGASAKTAAPANASNNSLAAMFKPPEGSWECDTCMVQNTSTALRCIACDSSKPGLQSAGIVSKSLSSSSSTDGQIKINPGGGFSFNVPSTTTTTTGSAGFKFGNSSASVITSNAAPISTGGFCFGSNSAQKDNNSVVNSSRSSSSGNSTNSMPLGGGFQFSTPSGTNSSNQSGAAVSFNSSTTTVSTSSSVSNPSGGFQFGAPSVTLSSAPSSTGGFALGTNATKPSSGFQFGASTTASSDTSSSDKAGFKFPLNNDESSQIVASSNNSQTSSSISSSVSFKLSDNNNTSTSKTAAGMGGFQFGSTASSIVSVDKKSESVPSQSTFVFGAKHATTNSQTTSPFVFGAPVSSSSSQSSSVGLGTGQSLAMPAGGAHAAPLVNGSFGAGQNNSMAPTNGGFNVNSGGFSFGSKQPSQNSLTKRSIDGVENEGPSAKINTAFGSVTKEPTVNGGFNFNANAGSFAFGSSQPSQPAVGGFEFSPPVPSGQVAPGFAFTAKAGQETQPAKTSDVSFSVNPNFNFSATPAEGSAVFQFGTKAAASEAASSANNMFAFGASSNAGSAMSQPNVAVFGASPAPAPAGLGTFSIGSTSDTSQRKMKKAVRRIKPR